MDLAPVNIYQSTIQSESVSQFIYQLVNNFQTQFF